MFSNFDTSASGLTAQRLRMDTVADNIANVNTTRTEEGEPYRRRMPVFSSRDSGSFANFIQRRIGRFGQADEQGVEVTEIAEDESPFKQVYNPEHPDADEEGYVEKPNVDITMEMVDMIDASRAYEANVTALDTSKNMAMRALDIGGA